VNRRDILKWLGFSVATAPAVLPVLLEAAPDDGVALISAAHPVAESGYTELESGLTMQWGVANPDGTATFPLAFREVFSVTAHNAGGPSPTSFTTTGAQMAPDAQWLAIGYAGPHDFDTANMTYKSYELRPETLETLEIEIRDRG
jgi:hypothetical protein